MRNPGGAASRRRRNGSALLLVLALLTLPRQAAAYIDPGTGSLILQGLIAAFAAAAVVLRGYWYRIKAFFRGDKAAGSADAKADSTPGAQPKPPGAPE